MVARQRKAARPVGMVDRLHARLAMRSRSLAPGAMVLPDPVLIGRPALGRALLAGRVRVGGEIFDVPGLSIWEIAQHAGEDGASLHGFRWLDDLAAVGDAAARSLAQDWLFDWIARHGRGGGAGWTAALAGARLLRWLDHAHLLLRGRPEPDRERFRASVAGQADYLGRRWRSAPSGAARLEALAALIQANLVLQRSGRRDTVAVAAFAAEAGVQIDAAGGVATRCPEDLLDRVGLILRTEIALRHAGRATPDALGAAVERAAPTLRALRHVDGGLALFHGGDRGIEGRLEQVLGVVPARPRRPNALAMGFARLAAGRVSVVVDAAPPPTGAASAVAHASTLAFELTSGRRPLVVSCGPGGAFGRDWSRAGRATPSHSTLCIEGVSSARIATGRRDGQLIHVPRRVPVEFGDAEETPGHRLQVGHDGWQRSHGLTHARTLTLAPDGRRLDGTDLLTTLGDRDRTRFDRALDETGGQGIPFAVRFHLHPDVEADEPDAAGTLRLVLRSGEAWLFRTIEADEVALEPSVYLASGRLQPRAAQQVVLSGRAINYATRVRWSLAKSDETPEGLRDTAPDGDDQATG